MKWSGSTTKNTNRRHGQGSTRSGPLRRPWACFTARGSDTFGWDTAWAAGAKAIVGAAMRATLFILLGLLAGVLVTFRATGGF